MVKVWYGWVELDWMVGAVSSEYYALRSLARVVVNRENRRKVGQVGSGTVT